MGAKAVPRAVVVTRPTEYELLLGRHGTRDQVRFFLETRGQSLSEAEDRHRAHEGALRTVSSAIPSPWRRARVTRSDLDRFLFEPADIVVAVGQDGLVANVAKYLEGQLVIGIDPSPGVNAGVLVPHPPAAAAALLRAADEGTCRVAERTMVEAVRDDGLALRALNEVFVGHRSHQSARYLLRCGRAEERQSSSGLIVSTGTGGTGWALSISRTHPSPRPLPEPGDPRLVYLVREAWPSPATGTSLVEGVLEPGDTLEVVSQMGEGGVAFGDGIEADAVELPWGARLHVGVSARRLRMVAGA